MAKKNFTDTINSTSSVYAAIEQAVAQDAPQAQEAQAVDATHSTQEVQEVQEVQQLQEVTPVKAISRGKGYKRNLYTAEQLEEFKENLKTHGRKGAALPRINLAFTPSNYNYIRIMSAVRGITITDLIDEILTQHREAHADIYEKAIEFQNSMK